MAEVIKTCGDCKVLEIVDTPLGDARRTACRQLTTSLLPALRRRVDPLRSAINDLYFDFMAPSLAVGRHRPGDGPPRQHLGRRRQRGRPSSASATGEYQVGTVAEPLRLQGWQIVDELNRAFAGEAPSGYVAPAHLFTPDEHRVRRRRRRTPTTRTTATATPTRRSGASKPSEPATPRRETAPPPPPPRSPIRHESMRPMATPRPAQARLRAQHEAHRPHDQGGRPDGVQLMVNKGYAYRRPHVLQGLQRHRRARPAQPEAGRLRRRAAQHLEHSTCRPSATCCSSINAKDMFAAAEFPTSSNYYKGALGQKVGTAEAKAPTRNWSAGMAVYDIAKPGRAAADRLHAGRGRRHPPHLVHRRPLGLRLGAARRLHRLHLHHHRHGRPDQAAARPAASGCPA